MTNKEGKQQLDSDLAVLDAEVLATGRKIILRITDGSDQSDPKTWSYNAKRFNTVSEAETYREDLYMRWFGMKAWFFDLAPKEES